jgi:hypothetical protein
VKNGFVCIVKIGCKHVFGCCNSILNNKNTDYHCLVDIYFLRVKILIIFAQWMFIFKGFYHVNLMCLITVL